MCFVRLMLTALGIQDLEHLFVAFCSQWPDGFGLAGYRTVASCVAYPEDAATMQIIRWTAEFGGVHCIANSLVSYDVYDVDGNVATFFKFFNLLHHFTPSSLPVLWFVRCRRGRVAALEWHATTTMVTCWPTRWRRLATCHISDTSREWLPLYSSRKDRKVIANVFFLTTQISESPNRSSTRYIPSRRFIAVDLFAPLNLQLHSSYLQVHRSPGFITSLTGTFSEICPWYSLLVLYGFMYSIRSPSWSACGILYGENH